MVNELVREFIVISATIIKYKMNTLLFYTLFLIILYRISAPLAIVFLLYIAFYIIPQQLASTNEHFADINVLTPMVESNKLVSVCEKFPSPSGGKLGSFVSSKLNWDNTREKTQEQEHVRKYLYGYITGGYDKAIESIFELLLSFYPLVELDSRPSVSEETNRSDILSKLKRYYEFLILPRLLLHRPYDYNQTQSSPYRIKIGPSTGVLLNDTIVYNKTELRRDTRFTIYQRIITDGNLCSSTDTISYNKKRDVDIKETDYKLCDPIRDVDILYKGDLFKTGNNISLNYYPNDTNVKYYDLMNIINTFSINTKENQLKMKNIKCNFIDGKYKSHIDDVLNLIWTIKQYLLDNKSDSSDTLYEEYCRIMFDVYTLANYRVHCARNKLRCDI